MSVAGSFCGLIGLAVCVAGSVLASPLNLARIRNSKVRYEAPSKLKVFPVPLVSFHREGLAPRSDREQILQKIVYPVINRSERPIAAINVEFPPGYRRSFGVDVYWHHGKQTSILFTKDEKGQVPGDAYRQFFVNDDPER